MSVSLAPSTAAFQLHLDQLLDELQAHQERMRREARGRLEETVVETSTKLNSIAQQLRTGWEGFDASTLEGRARDLVDRAVSVLPEPGAARLDHDDLLRLQSELRLVRAQLTTILPELPVRRSRPMNVVRSSFHLLSGLGAVFVSEALLGPTWAAICAVALALTGWTLEGTRRLSPAWNRVLMRLFSPVAHPHEVHTVNSATWYVTALALLFSTTVPAAAHVGVLALAIGDPAAGIIGRRYGKTRLIDGKSLEGATAFVVASWMLVSAYLVLLGHATVGAALLAAVAAAVVGATAELVAGRLNLDDNFTVPLASGWAAGLVLLLA